MKFLNDKLEQNKALKGQPQGVVKLHQKIGFLKETLSKFVRETKKLDKLLRIKKCSFDRSEP